MPQDTCELLCLDLTKGEELRAQRVQGDVARSLAERSKALGDATRFSIALSLSRTDELCVCDLAWIEGRSENLVSHHLGILRKAGLVTCRREGKMALYSITATCRRQLQALRERDEAEEAAL